MRFTVIFKTPDVLEDLTDEQKEFAEKYMKYGEYITIEFDPFAQTAKVVCRD